MELSFLYKNKKKKVFFVHVDSFKQGTEHFAVHHWSSSREEELLSKY
jgi:hypothetical protein